jgi:hypothetical protein
MKLWMFSARFSIVLLRKIAVYTLLFLSLWTEGTIPAAMAAIYLMLLLYFKATGGYKAVHLEGTSAGKH